MTSSDQDPGRIAWHDLTVTDAEAVRDFYTAVAGWRAEAVSMGEYDDYCMLDTDGNAVAGICYARGANANLPPQWLCYVTVADLDTAVAAAEARGGAVIDGPRRDGESAFAVLRDPAGAVVALYQSGQREGTS